jgi:glycerol uptake facilitator-like aquaporin
MIIGLMLGWSEISIKAAKIDIFEMGLIQFAVIAFVTATTINFSGAMLNPVITTSMATSNRIKGYKIVSYMVAQFLGYLTGSILLRILIPIADKKAFKICYGCFNLKEVNIVSAIINELIGGFLLAFAYFSSVIDKRASKGVYVVAIAAVYFVMNLSFGKMMTIGINPFRYLAGALINFDHFDFSCVLVYLLPSILGAIICSKFFDEYVLSDQPKISENHIKFD